MIRSRNLLWMLLAGLLLTPAWLSPSCSSISTFRIVNRTSETLSITLAVSKAERITPADQRIREGELASGESLSRLMPESFRAYFIEARNEHGITVYRAEFTREQLDEMGWEVVIRDELGTAVPLALPLQSLRDPPQADTLNLLAVSYPPTCPAPAIKLHRP